MFIVSKDRESIFNADNAACIYVGERMGLKLTTKSGAGYRLGIYNSEAEARAALNDLAKHMGSGPSVYFLADDDTAAMLVKAENPEFRPTRYHGAKPERRGGS